MNNGASNTLFEQLNTSSQNIAGTIYNLLGQYDAAVTTFINFVESNNIATITVGDQLVGDFSNFSEVTGESLRAQYHTYLQSVNDINDLIQDHLRRLFQVEFELREIDPNRGYHILVDIIRSELAIRTRIGLFNY